jgi:hypothetical protein
VIAVGFAQPATVRITAESTLIKGDNYLVTVTATLAPPTLIGVSYLWWFSSTPTTLNQVQFEHASGTVDVKVTVTLAGGGTVDGSAKIVVK